MPHYTTFVGESEIGIRLAEAMEDMYRGLIEAIPGPPPKYSPSVNLIEIGKMRRQLDTLLPNEMPEDIRRFHSTYEINLHETSLAEEVYKDVILELSEQITKIVANENLTDSDTYGMLSNYIKIMHKYIDSIPNVRLEEFKERKLRT